MLYATFVLSLLASAAVAQLSDSNLKTYVGALPLSSSFSPVKESYWTGLPHHRRTPFAVSPDGKSAYLAYLDASNTNVHVQQVDSSTFGAVGTAVTVTGAKEAGGLVAHNDGFALLTNEAMPSGTANAPPSNTPVAVLYRYTSGKLTFKTWLGGPDNVGGMGALATPDLNGDLVFSEASGMYGAYFVVTAYSGAAQGHFGDAIQYVSKDGTLKQISGASSSWGCSHNTGIAFAAADAVPFPSICSEDQGAIWLNTGGTGMDKHGIKISNENVTNGAGNEAMGGMSGSFSGLARFINSNSYIFSWVSRGAKDLTTNDWMGKGYTHSVNRTVNRNVAIATFSDKKTLNGKQATSDLVADGDSQVNWITTGSADCQNAHVAAFDSTNAVVTWEEIASPKCEFIAMGCKGAFTGSYFQLVNNGKKIGQPLKSTNVYVAGDMVTMNDGRVCWPYVDMRWTLDGPVRNPESAKAMSFACMSLSGANSGNSSSTPGYSAPAVTPRVSAQPPAAVSQASTVKEVALSTGPAMTLEAPVRPLPSVAAPPTTRRTSTFGDNDLPAPSDSVHVPASLSFNPSNAPAFTNVPTPPLPVFTSMVVDDDLPAPSKSIQIPASESFNPTNAPAFTNVPIVPVPKSTSLPVDDDLPAPSKSVHIPASQSFNPTNAPAFTERPDATTELVYSSTPINRPHCTEGELLVYPSGSKSAFPPSATETARPGNTNGENPGYGWGHPRPSGLWPSRGGPRPTASNKTRHPVGSGSRPSSAAMSTPRTFQTRVRPTPTPALQY